MDIGVTVDSLTGSVSISMASTVHADGTTLSMGLYVSADVCLHRANTEESAILRLKCERRVGGDA